MPLLPAMDAEEGPIEECPGWCRYLDDDGDVYYHHTESGVTQWEMPEAAALLASAAADA
eukprot:COSAG04_NODE_11581_length_701_cov_0.656146_1_plen_58_part_01